MTDIVCLCHNCRSVHDAESIQESLILDARDCQLPTVPAPWHQRSPQRFLRWRTTWGLAQVLWPGISASSTCGLGPWAGAGAARARSDRPVTAGQQPVAAMPGTGRR
jgi:hypothetical protein